MRNDSAFQHVQWRGGLTRGLFFVLSSLMVFAAPVTAFDDGDYYVANTHDIDDACAARGVIDRMDPVTFTRTRLYTDVNGPVVVPNLNSSISYDPYRDRIVFYEQTTGDGIDFSLLDDLGGVSALPDPTNVQWLSNSGGASPSHTAQTTSAEDGRIFLMARDATSANVFRFQYWDAGNVLHELLDQPGTAPYVVSVTGSGFGLYALHYHADQNALFVTEARGAPDLDTVIHKIPLSLDGTRVAGPPSTISLEVSTSTQDRATQWSPGPNGMLMLHVDTNSNANDPHQWLVNPVTLATQPWASSTGGVMTGGFHELNQDTAVARNWFDLVEIAENDSGGGGTELAADVFCGSGTHPAIIRITQGAPAVPLLGIGGGILLVGALAGTVVSRRAG